jgi:NAD(P)-dependent dehydrogenase (short-subunit alcohol dehydrogenase family)
MNDPFRLDNRTVVITGASRGIGAEVARAVASQGGQCVLVARSEGDLTALAASLPTPSRVVVGDVAVEGVAEQALAAAEELGGLWALVNNAGINPFYQPATQTTMAQWQEVLTTNLLAAANFARVVGGRLAELGAGRIVNLGSIAGLTGLPMIAPYSATKAALDSMAKTLAVELGPSGVLVNSVAPGTILTEMVSDLMEQNAALAERFKSRAPTGRMGEVHEAAWPIVFLLTDAASFITGHVLVVDGGRLAAG